MDFEIFRCWRLPLAAAEPTRSFARRPLAHICHFGQGDLHTVPCVEKVGRAGIISVQRPSELFPLAWCLTCVDEATRRNGGGETQTRESRLTKRAAAKTRNWTMVPQSTNPYCAVSAGECTHGRVTRCLYARLHGGMAKRTGGRCVRVETEDEGRARPRPHRLSGLSQAAKYKAKDQLRRKERCCELGRPDSRLTPVSRLTYVGTRVLASRSLEVRQLPSAHYSALW
jgi:hypothetical protein